MVEAETQLYVSWLREWHSLERRPEPEVGTCHGVPSSAERAAPEGMHLSVFGGFSWCLGGQETLCYEAPENKRAVPCGHAKCIPCEAEPELEPVDRGRMLWACMLRFRWGDAALRGL